MKIGPLIRRMFGPYERHISEVYRSMFLDIDAFVEQVRQWTPSPRRMLEIGCGEGAVSERLSAAYRDAKLTAIDISPNVGRLYQGPINGVSFIRCEIYDVSAAESEQFDLVVLCDVLHHVPFHARQALLDAVYARLSPGGSFIFKDWERGNTPIHWLCYISDRWLTGDRTTFMTREVMRQNLTASFGMESLVAETRVEPRWNNLAILVQLR